MKQFTAEVVFNRQVAERYYELEMTWSADAPAPGQFLTCKIGGTTDPLLRRPFAFSSYSGGQAGEDRRVRIIYERRGNATHELSTSISGDEIDVLGPLGKSFPLPDTTASCILAAGGIGVGPIVFLANTLAARGNDGMCVIGAREAGLIPHEVLNSMRFPVTITTDDGSFGLKGTVMRGIEHLEGGIPAQSVFYCCGPRPMMAAIASEAKKVHADCWVSLEQIMACGVGACMGCAVRVNDSREFARVCTEGPVFHADEIAW